MQEAQKAISDPLHSTFQLYLLHLPKRLPHKDWTFKPHPMLLTKGLNFHYHSHEINECPLLIISL